MCVCVCARARVSQQDNEFEQVREGERLLCGLKTASHSGDITTHFTLLLWVCVESASLCLTHTNRHTHSDTHDTVIRDCRETLQA